VVNVLANFKNAFLYGDLEEEIRVEQPPWYVAQGRYGVQAQKSDIWS